MNILNKVKMLFGRERRYGGADSKAESLSTTSTQCTQKPDPSKKRKFSDMLRSWGCVAEQTRAEGINSYTELLVQTSTDTSANNLLDLGNGPTSTLDLGEFIQQYEPKKNYSTPDSFSTAAPVLVLESPQPFYISFSPYPDHPAMSEIPTPPIPSIDTSSRLVHPTVSKTSSHTSVPTAPSSISAGSRNSSSTRTDFSETLPVTATHGHPGEHSSFKEQKLPSITPDFIGDCQSSSPSSDTTSSFTLLQKGARQETDRTAEQEDDVVHNSSHKATIQTTGSGENRDLLDRHDWDTIHKIPDLHLKRLLLSETIGMHNGTATIDDCKINARFDGGFNHIALMVLSHSDLDHHFVVRVPAIGTPARWQIGDAHNMRCEMSLLAHLRKTTTIPVPEVLAYADNLDTPIGAPFCLMKQLRGKPAHHVWFKDPANRNHVTANDNDAETETKRCNILRSLAHIMAELQTLTFDKIGTPDLANASLTKEPHSVTHSYRWKSPREMKASDLENEGQTYRYGPFKSSEEYMTSDLEESWPSTPSPDLDPEDKDDKDTQNTMYGMRKIIDLIYAQPTIALSLVDPDDVFEDESFVLRHPDLDFQNILVSDNGFVTGIIDWEGCMAVPRCAGYASLPDFLCRDWSAGHSLRDSPHMTWKLRHYRQVYADAMKETGAPEAKYTLKSAMYRAVVDAINEGNPPDLIEKLFVHIPDLRTTNVEEFEQFIGEGWPEALEFLGEELHTLFKPEAF